jgi:hypothetical protein
MIGIAVSGLHAGLTSGHDLPQRFASHMRQKPPAPCRSRDGLPHISCMVLARPQPQRAPLHPSAPPAHPRQPLRASARGDARTSVKRGACDQNAPQRPRDPTRPRPFQRTGTAALIRAAPMEAVRCGERPGQRPTAIHAGHRRSTSPVNAATSITSESRCLAAAYATTSDADSLEKTARCIDIKHTPR